MSAPDARTAAAESLLQEAVFRSRARQAASHALPGEAGTKGGAGSGAGCGLGRSAEVELDLSERGRELYRELWPRGLAGEPAQRLRQALESWIGEQDALDRRRNHFLRDFRARHGADRRSYSPEQAREYELGLERVNADETRRRGEAAEILSRLC